MNIGVVRERLVRFFQEQNPEKLQIVDDIIAQYSDDFDQLFIDLKERYGVPVPEVDENDLPHNNNNNNKNQQKNDNENNNAGHPNDDDDDNQSQQPDEADNYFPLSSDNNNNNNSSPLKLTAENLGSSFVNRQPSVGSGTGAGNNATNNTAGNAGGGSKKTLNNNENDDNNDNNNVRYLEPDAQVLADMDDWDVSGLPDVDPRIGLRFYSKPAFADPVWHTNNNNNNNIPNAGKKGTSPNNNNNSRAQPQQPPQKQHHHPAAEPEYFSFFKTLIEEHILYWFSPIKKFYLPFWGGIGNETRIGFITDRCLFLAKPTKEAEITRVIHIHEIACLFTNADFVEKDHKRFIDIDHKNNQNGSSTPTTKTNGNPNNSSEENFIVIKILPKEGQHPDDVESGCYDLYFSLPTLQETRDLVKILSTLHKFNPNTTGTQDLLVTPIAAPTPLEQQVIALNLKRPSRHRGGPQDVLYAAILPRTRAQALEEIRKFAETNGVVYSRSGQVKKAPRALVDPDSGRLLLTTKRRSGVVIPIAGLRGVQRDERRKEKQQARSEAMDIMRRANRTVQDGMMTDPHRTVMNDPGDILAYRNQKALNEERMAAVANVTASFAARSLQIQQQQSSPSTSYDQLIRLQQNQNQQQNSPSSSPSKNNDNGNNSMLLKEFSPIHPSNSVVMMMAMNQNQNNISNNNNNNNVIDNNNGPISPSIPSPSRLLQMRQVELLKSVAPTIFESWNVIRESAPAPIHLRHIPAEKRNVVRRPGAEHAAVIEATKAHQATVNNSTVSNNHQKGINFDDGENDNNNNNDNKQPLVSPEKAWSHRSSKGAVNNNNQNNRNSSNHSGGGLVYD